MRRRAIPPAFAFLALVLILGALATALTVATGIQGQRSITRRDLVDGTAAANADRRIEEEHPWRDGSLHVLTAIRFLVFRDLPGVVIGQNAHIFTEEEFLRPAFEDKRADERLDLIVELVGEVRDAGAEALVVLLPTKARMQADYLPVRMRARARDERYDTAIAYLSAAGVSVLDPRSALPADAFFHRDTHWTPAGAKAVAEEVARYLTRQPFTATLASAPVAQFQRVAEETIEVPGDLMNFVPLGRLRDGLGLGPEIVVATRYVAGESDLGLFGELVIPILLVGTSFSADQRWAFDSAIGVETARDVLNLAASGEGPFVPLRRVLDEGRIEEYGSRVLVWEIPERYLSIDLP